MVWRLNSPRLLVILSVAAVAISAHGPSGSTATPSACDENGLAPTETSTPSVAMCAAAKSSGLPTATMQACAEVGTLRERALGAWNVGVAFIRSRDDAAALPWIDRAIELTSLVSPRMKPVNMLLQGGEAAFRTGRRVKSV